MMKIWENMSEDAVTAVILVKSSTVDFLTLIIKRLNNIRVENKV